MNGVRVPPSSLSLPPSVCPGRRDHPGPLQIAQHLGDAGLQVLPAGVDAQLRRLGGFVGAGDARELLDFAGTRLGIEALGVPLFAHL